MKVLENLKQFTFASVLFVTCVSMHWNFVASQRLDKQSEVTKKVHTEKQIQILKEKLAFATNNRTAKI
jgi:uncharacterized membrane protein YqhA